MAKFTDTQSTGIVGLCEEYGLTVNFNHPCAVAGMYNPNANFIDRDLEHLTELGLLAGYTFTYNVNDHTFLFIADPRDIIKDNDKVVHVKSRKEGKIVSIDNGLAEIELTGELYKDSPTKYTHLCLLENLVKL